MRIGVTSVLPVLLISGVCAGAAIAARPATAHAPKQYVYVLHVSPRLYAESLWTAADNQAVQAHFARLQRETAAGRVILAGRTTEPLDRTFGLVVFEAPSDDSAAAFMRADPAVAAGVMTATVHPYSVALLRK
jgi:uncharacterized protein